MPDFERRRPLGALAGLSLALVTAGGLVATSFLFPGTSTLATPATVLPAATNALDAPTPDPTPEPTPDPTPEPSPSAVD